MAETPIDIERFSGLNLSRDVTRVPPTAAIDLLNVDFDHTEIIRSRDGYVPFGATTATWGALHGAGTGKLLAHDTTAQKMRVYDQTGALLATSSDFSGIRTTGICTIGTPSTTYTYIAAPPVPTGGVWRYDHVANSFSGGAAVTYFPSHIALSPLDNRLAVAVETPPRGQVRFSDPGDPETFGANNYVYLTPGDGEFISAMVTWRDYLFVFKQTKFFVFYGQSTDSTGQPIFNYRSYVGTGAMTCQGAAVAGRDGVYFITNDGIWRTTGGDAQRISSDIDLLFRDPTSLGYWTGSQVTPDQSTRLGFWNDRLFISWDTSGTSSGPYATLVYSTAIDSWTYWDVDAAHITNVPRDGEALTITPASSRAMFGSPLTASKVMRLDPTVTSDNGVAIPTRYRSGFFRVAEPGSEGTIRETQIVGSGELPFAWAFDFKAPVAARTVSLGTPPLLGRAKHRDAVHGEYFSYTLGGATASSWSCTRVVPLVRGVRPESLQA